MSCKLRQSAIALVFGGTPIFFAMPTLAEIVSYHFIGEVTFSNCPPVVAQQAVTGTLSYDSTILPSFDTGSVAGDVGSDGRVEYIVNVAGVSIQNDAGKYSLQVLNNSSNIDNFNGSFDPVSGGIFETSSFRFTDSTQTVFSSTALPDSLDLSDFTSSTGSLSCGVGGSVFFNIVEFVRPPVAVTIDIKPRNEKNPVNPRSKLKLKVAILTTEDFDASTVNASTVTFGPGGAAPIRYRLDDVDHDADWDLVLKFGTRDTGIACGDLEATLIGQTFDGQAITGTDSIKTVGCRKK